MSVVRELVCTLFGHRWFFPTGNYSPLVCSRCGIEA